MIQLQSGKRRSIPIEHIPDEILSNLPDTRARVLPGAIKSLPLRLSIPFLARYLAGATIAEIAEEQGVSIDTVVRRIRRAEQLIRGNLQD